MALTILLDFDGVILESVSVKTDAFRSLFSFSPDHVDEIVQYHIDNGGMSRFEKIRYIYSHILHKELSQETFDALSHRFSELVEEKVANAPFVDGALTLLETQYADHSLYIISATPQEELVRIVNNRGISRFFKGIFGAPDKKTEHIQRILTEKKMSPHDVIFVGDAVNDWEAARNTGIRFIGRNKPGDPNRFVNLAGVERIITSLDDLNKYIKEIQ
jgi:beta-phosphoglucomutase